MMITLGVIGIVLGMYTSMYSLDIKVKDINFKTGMKMTCISLGIISFITMITIFLYIRYGFTNQFISMEISTWFLIIISIKDIRDKEVPFDVSILALFLGTVLIFLNPNIMWFESLIGLFGVGGALAGVSYLTKGSLGMGDALVIGIIGLLLGYKMAIGVLLYSLVLCGVIGLILMVLGKVSRKTRLPMVPFILSAFLIIVIL